MIAVEWISTAAKAAETGTKAEEGKAAEVAEGCETSTVEAGATSRQAATADAVWFTAACSPMQPFTRQR